MFGALTLHADDATPPSKDGKDAKPAARTLSAAEMKVEASRMQEQLDTAYQNVVRLRDGVRGQKDIIKLNCINDRIVQIKAQLNIADAARTSLFSSLDRNSDERHAHFQSLSEAADGVRKLKEEANGCAGAPEIVKQEGGVEVSHPYIPDDPTIVDPFDPQTWDPNEIEPPGYASPFF
ncbi:MAG: hypothetical protein ACKV2T_09725 [Kofleriaceae bacterium]